MRQTQTGMSSYRSPYISFLAFTWDRSENEVRLVWLRLGLWNETSYFHTGLSSYRSHVNGNESQTGSGSNMYLLLVLSFLLFLSNDSITIADNIVYIDNISKQDVESSINWIYACFNAWESAILIACSRLRDSGESVNWEKEREKKQRGWGGTRRRSL